MAKLTKYEKEQLQREIEARLFKSHHVKIDLSYVLLDDAIDQLLKAKAKFPPGSEPRVEIECYDDYGSSRADVLVIGKILRTDKELIEYDKLIADRARQAELRDLQQLALLKKKYEQE